MSTIKVNAIQNTSGVEVYTAKAWVNFNGVGTVAIRASGNVSSITDSGVGLFTINFTNAMPDSNYCATGSSTSDATGTANSRMAAITFFRSYATTSVLMLTHSVNITDNLYADPILANVAIFR